MWQTCQSRKPPTPYLLVTNPSLYCITLFSTGPSLNQKLPILAKLTDRRALMPLPAWFYETGSSLRCPGYPRASMQTWISLTHSNPSISVPSAGIKVVSYHFQLILLFLMYVLVIKLCPFICTVNGLSCLCKTLICDPYCCFAWIKLPFYFFNLWAFISVPWIWN